MLGQIYIVDQDKASLLLSDGTTRELHYVQEDAVTKVVTGNVTNDGAADAVYQYEWGGFGLVDYNVDGSFEMKMIEPGVFLANPGLSTFIDLHSTADVTGGEGEEIIFQVTSAFTDDASRGIVYSSFYAYDAETGETTTLFSGRGDVKAFGDLDANGKDDVVYADEWGGLFVRLDGGNSYHLTDITTDRSTTLVGVGEFAEGFPGLDEMVFYNSDTREFSAWVKGPVARNGGIVSVDYFQEIFKLPEGWSFNGIGDFDGDGLDDIMIAQTGDAWIQMVGVEMPLAYWSSAEGKLVEVGTHDLRAVKGGEDFVGLIQPAEGGRLMDGATIDLTGVDLTLV